MTKRNSRRINYENRMQNFLRQFRDTRSSSSSGSQDFSGWKKPKPKSADEQPSEAQKDQLQKGAQQPSGSIQNVGVIQPGQPSNQTSVEQMDIPEQEEQPKTSDESDFQLTDTEPITDDPGIAIRQSRLVQPQLKYDPVKTAQLYPKFENIQNLVRSKVSKQEFVNLKLKRKFGRRGFTFPGNLLGAGAYGTVELCTWTKGGKPYLMACKRISLLNAEKRSVNKVIQNINDEVEILKIIANDKNANILGVIYTYAYQSARQLADFPMAVYIFMDKADGNLMDFMINFCRDRRLKQNDIRKLLGQMLNALNYLHHQDKTNEKGETIKISVAHLDIKPENILIFQSKADETAYLFKLADFGVSIYQKFEQPDQKFLSNRFRGTPNYMAPEFKQVFLNKKEYDPCLADVYSLGIVIIETIAGFQSNSDALQTLKADVLEAVRKSDKSKLLSVYEVGHDLTYVLRLITQKEANRRATVKDLMDIKFVRQWKYDGGYSPMYCVKKTLAKNSHQIRDIEREEMMEEEALISALKE